MGHPFLLWTETFPPIICSGVVASLSAAKKPSPTSKTSILRVLRVHPTAAGLWLEQTHWESSFPAPLCPCCPQVGVTLLTPPWLHTLHNQLSLHGAMPCHLAPDGPMQGARASMCKLSLSTLMGSGTRLASDICFEYSQTVLKERSPLLSVLLGVKSRQHLRKKIKITALVPAPRSPNSKQAICISTRTSKNNGTSGWSRVFSAFSYS